MCLENIILKLELKIDIPVFKNILGLDFVSPQLLYQIDYIDKTQRSIEFRFQWNYFD